MPHLLDFVFPSIRRKHPARHFHSSSYLRHNARRLEHLSTLGLPLVDSRVLELGAGIGDHTSFYIDRGCDVVITDGRPENVRLARQRYPGAPVLQLDMESPEPVPGAPFDVTHCYGLLYHLRDPDPALDFIAASTSRLALIETCVSFGDEETLNPVRERDNATQALRGEACRPTRAWVFSRLRDRFPHVYTPRTQPRHEEFPIDWTAPEDHPAALARAIFVAAKEPLDNPNLAPDLLDRQVRQP